MIHQKTPHMWILKFFKWFLIIFHQKFFFQRSILESSYLRILENSMFTYDRSDIEKIDCFIIFIVNSFLGKLVNRFSLDRGSKVIGRLCSYRWTWMVLREDWKNFRTVESFELLESLSRTFQVLLAYGLSNLLTTNLHNNQSLYRKTDLTDSTNNGTYFLPWTSSEIEKDEREREREQIDGKSNVVVTFYFARNVNRILQHLGSREGFLRAPTSLLLFIPHCVRLSDDILKRVSTVVAPGHGERGEYAYLVRRHIHAIPYPCRVNSHPP